MILAALGIVMANYVSLGHPLAEVLRSDKRNEGIAASVHFGGYVNRSVLVFDLTRVSPENAPMDVFRVLLQFAAAVKHESFARVELAHQGRTKFVLSGEHFSRLGAEYGAQNPIYTLRTLPEHLYLPDGRAAYPQWTGGWLGVVGKQMDDFSDFHRKWYIDDLTGK